METLRERLTSQLGQLKKQRDSWLKVWRDLGENFYSSRSRYLFSGKEPNRGDRRNGKIIDNAPVFALRTLASGMMAGLTSPARPWFRLTTPDPEMMEYEPVRRWLYQVERRLLDVFSKSNLYNVLPTTYRELGGYGTSPLMLLEDARRVIRAVPFTAGSYCLATDEHGHVDTFYREFKMTARQMAKQFGEDSLSGTVRSLLHNKGQEGWIDVIHCVRPRENRDVTQEDSRNMPWMSVYFEGKQSEKDSLSEGGFQGNPLLAPRWDVYGEDVYGQCPAMDALGDAKQLQYDQRKKAKAIDKHVDPPMWGSPDLKTQKASLIAGDITYTQPMGNGSPGFKPVYEIQPQIQSLLEDIQDIRARISRALYEDLFLMLAMSDRREITAREVEERHEEKLLMLGPVLERLNAELLDPLIDRTFQIMVQRSLPFWEGRLYGEALLPPPPDELGDVNLKVEYISILAQAQRAVATTGMERFGYFIAGLRDVAPDVIDKIDADQAADEYALALGVPPTIVRSDDEVADIRQQRAQQQQAEQMAAMAQPLKDASVAAKNASETQVGDDTLLNQMTGAA